MCKLTFIGAGSTVFAHNALGDVMMCDALKGSALSVDEIVAMVDALIAAPQGRHTRGYCRFFFVCIVICRLPSA